VKISEEVRKELVRNLTDFCRTVRKVDPEEALSFIVADQYLFSQADYYAEAFKRMGIDPRTSRILEVGSGYGFFLSEARASSAGISGASSLARRNSAAAPSSPPRSCA
jgi:hypothetical protein